MTATNIDFGKHYVGDSKEIEFTVKDPAGDVVDISSATTLEVGIKAKSGTCVKKTGAFRTDGEDGVFYGAFVPGDFTNTDVGRAVVEGSVLMGGNEYTVGTGMLAILATIL